jgi:hypothetical protein
MDWILASIADQLSLSNASMDGGSGAPAATHTSQHWQRGRSRERGASVRHGTEKGDQSDGSGAVTNNSASQVIFNLHSLCVTIGGQPSDSAAATRLLSALAQVLQQDSITLAPWAVPQALHVVRVLGPVAGTDGGQAVAELAQVLLASDKVGGPL